jgi:hypothetical protein
MVFYKRWIGTHYRTRNRSGDTAGRETVGDLGHNLPAIDQ